MPVARSIALFAVAALFEIGGAWLVWQGIREHKGWIWIGAGVIALGLYGVVATFQNDDDFGRILHSTALPRQGQRRRSPTSARNNSASRRNLGTRQVTPSHAQHNDPGTGQRHMIDRTAPNRSRISPS
ncbi:YnfA family protein [Streptomyces sp. NPDC056669]|uniref:YnfA family protein n=1 Tax=unclassified Streptomyces TaxID=2593676 RepID=UPI00368E93C0